MREPFVATLGQVLDLAGAGAGQVMLPRRATAFSIKAEMASSSPDVQARHSPIGGFIRAGVGEIIECSFACPPLSSIDIFVKDLGTSSRIWRERNAIRSRSALQHCKCISRQAVPAWAAPTTPRSPGSMYSFPARTALNQAIVASGRAIVVQLVAHFA